MHRICIILLFILGLGGIPLFAQSVLPFDSLATLQSFEAPSVRSFLAHTQSRTLLILTSDIQAFSTFLRQRDLPASGPIQLIPRQGAVLVRLSPKEYRQNVRFYSDLRFVDVRDRHPIPERAQERFDLSLNRVNVLRRAAPQLSGQQQIISVKEPRFDSTDIDLRGRYVPSGLATSYLSGHATNMATMIAGSGQSFITGLGVAPAAQLSSTSFLRLFPDPDTYFLDYDIHVQNHSYGLGIENYYGAEARAYDEQVYMLPWLTHVFSAGNQGEATPESGVYAALTGTANLTGTFKQAKNVLTVGALDSLGIMVARSSRGPAYDGRIKPELTAYGTDGSSGAAAITSGLAALLQQQYQQQHNGMPMDAALLRALLINSARDLGPEGPDYRYGYGMVDAPAALRQANTNHYVHGTVGQNDSFTYTLNIPENALNLRITLAWVDPPADLQATTALVHDLDLSLLHPAGQATTLPWVKSTVANADSLRAPARRAIDTLHNQELLTLKQPLAGTYQIQVKGRRITADATQSFYLVYNWDTPGQFSWDFPAKDDVVRAGEQQVLRWSQTLTAADSGQIQVRYAGDARWQGVTTNDVLDAGYYPWIVADTFTRAQLRMLTPTETFVSDTFTIARPLELEVAYQCSDNLLFTWEDIPQAIGYRLYQLIDQEMQVISQSEEPRTMLPTPEDIDTYFAVAPVLPDGTEALRSLALNLQFQSVPCYTSGLSGQIDGNVARLALTLSSREGLLDITLEKWIDGAYQSLSRATPAQNELTWIDHSLQTGPNQYRAVLHRDNGQTTTTLPRTLYYFGDQPILVFPNPISANSLLSIFITSEYTGSYFELYNAQGRLVRRYDVLSERENLFLGNLQAGFYTYQLVPADAAPVASGRLIIQ